MSNPLLLENGLGPLLLENGLGPLLLTPTVTTIFPHDDYDDRPSFWRDTRRRQKGIEARLAAMRAEIGLLPEAVAQPAVARAEAAVARAAERIIEQATVVRSKPDVHRLTAIYLRSYQDALRSVLEKARFEDLERAFLAEVRERVDAEHRARRKRQRIVRDDDEVMAMFAGMM